MIRIFEFGHGFMELGEWVAVVLCRAYGGNLHAGFIYRSESTAKTLHLGWEDKLLDTEYPNGLFILPDIEPEHAFSLARMCKQIWRRFCDDGTFPYALRYAGTTFDLQGKLECGPGARGLTCATLVLAIFKAVGHVLVNEQSWPIRTDDDRNFLEAIRRYATPEHFAILEREVTDGVKRVRPEEVAGACLLERPVDFEPARRRADDLVERLDDAVLQGALSSLSPVRAED